MDGKLILEADLLWYELLRLERLAESQGNFLLARRINRIAYRANQRRIRREQLAAEAGVDDNGESEVRGDAEDCSK